MPELAQAEVLAAPGRQQRSGGGKTLQAWRAVLNCVAFLLQVLLQVLRGTPSSLTQLLSYLGVRYPAAALCPSPQAPTDDVAFKPLPTTEIPPEAPPPLPPLPVVAVEETLEKLMVVLDLDETLVCAYETCSLPTVVRSQAIEAGLKCFELECISSEKEADGRQKVNHVTVFERPGLQEFLQQASEFADLVLFTAGLEGYARPLVDRIDVENRFSLRLYRPSTTTTEYREHVKDLCCLSKNLHRIVIVDNNPFSFLLQPVNGIPCLPFFAGQPHDEQLMGYILPLLRHLSLQKDVRPVLYERFHMPEWFRKHGIPMSNWIICDSPTTSV